MIIVLEGHTSNSYVDVYANESSNYPTLIREHHSIYGCSTGYYYLNNQFVNCYGYVLGGSFNLSINTLPSGSPLPPNGLYNYVANQVISDLANKGYTASRIDSYDSYIGANERRIAMKFNIVNSSFGAFHFMKQCNDGTWADKNDLGASEVHSYGENPDNTTCQYWSLYTSSVIYFAIE